MNYKYQFKITGLECANCAKRVENALKKNENIVNAEVNFTKMTVKIETPLNKNVKKIVSDIVAKEEPGSKILDIDEKEKKTLKFDIIRLLIGLILLGLSFLIKINPWNQIIIILVYIILLFRVAKKAILLLKNFILDENLLITISCVGAYFTNNVHEGLMVIILYEIGKILENLAVNNSRKSISDLMNIKPEYANLKVDNKIMQVKPEDVKIDDLIIIKKGEKIPLDGKIVEGECLLDKSALTGESLYVKAEKGEEVLSGSINVDGLITVKVSKLYENSTVAQILSLVENASDKKAKTENFVSKAARIYTPIILGLAILISIILPLLFKVPINDALYRALVFLVVSCPCAIAISVPLSYFTGLGASSKEGILIKGSNFLESSAKIKEIIFDKTGTITNDNNNKISLEMLSEHYNKDEVIQYLVSGENLSNHPIAKTIINNFKIDKLLKVSNFKEISGLGITYTVKKKDLKVGSYKLWQKSDNKEGTFIVIDDELVAKINIKDDIKENVRETINNLKEQGINVKMFTGDDELIAREVAEKVGISDVYYELLPKDKYNLVNKLIKEGHVVAFVGDGINDAPSLKLASIGISMGSIGSEAAIEASDIVIMNDNIDSLITLIKIAKRTNKIIKQNLIFAIGTKLLVLILSSFGLASMWGAVFADTGVTLLTILNTTRILRIKK